MIDITKKWTGHRQDWGQIHSQETVIGWKYRLGFGDFPELAVKSFNRVRGIDQTSDSFRILKIR